MAPRSETWAVQYFTPYAENIIQHVLKQFGETTIAIHRQPEHMIDYKWVLVKSIFSKPVVLEAFIYITMPELVVNFHVTVLRKLKFNNQLIKKVEAELRNDFERSAKTLGKNLKWLVV